MYIFTTNGIYLKFKKTFPCQPFDLNVIKAIKMGLKFHQMEGVIYVHNVLYVFYPSILVTSFFP